MGTLHSGAAKLSPPALFLPWLIGHTAISLLIRAGQEFFDKMVLLLETAIHWNKCLWKGIRLSKTSIGKCFLGSQDGFSDQKDRYREMDSRITNNSVVRPLSWEEDDPGSSPYSAWFRAGTWTYNFHIPYESHNHEVMGFSEVGVSESLLLELFHFV